VHNRPLLKVAKECKIPETTLRGWKRKFEDDGVLLKGRKRTKGNGTKPFLPQSVEEELANWIKDGRKAGLAITTDLLKGKALELYSGDNFKASDGWCYNFLHRWNLSTRSPTKQRVKNTTSIEERDKKIRKFWQTITAE